jgi:hypothetical protein
MKRVLVLILFIIFNVSYSKTIYGEYTYRYSDAETLIDAKQKCQTLAKRDAVEKFATFLRSETIIRNYMTEQDDIMANAEALITDVKVIEENIDRFNTVIFYKVSAEVDEEQILAEYQEREKIKLERIEAERIAQAERLEAERKLQAENLEAQRIAEAEKRQHDLEKARIEQETEKYKLSRELNEKDKRFWSTQKWIALGAFVGSAGLGTYFNSQGSSYYDDYESAKTSASALDFYDKADSNYLYRDVTFSVSVVPLGYFFYAWYRESKY